MMLPPVVSDPEWCPRRPFIEGEEHVWEDAWTVEDDGGSLRRIGPITVCRYCCERKP